LAVLLGADGAVGVPRFILTVAEVSPGDEYVIVYEELLVPDSPKSLKVAMPVPASTVAVLVPTNVAPALTVAVTTGVEPVIALFPESTIEI
jgi:hypothetical protein